MSNFFLRHKINFSSSSLHLPTVIPCTKVVKLGKNVPAVDGAFIASSATVVGKVKISKGASVWYGAVLRGETYYFNDIDIFGIYVISAELNGILILPFKFSLRR